MMRPFSLTQALGLVVLGLILCAFAPHDLPLSPGDPDYPSLNTQARESIRLKVKISKQLAVEITVDYQSTSHKPDCLVFRDEGGPQAMTVSIPAILDWSEENNEWSVQLHPDGVLPGRCGWKFSGLSARVQKGSVASARNKFLLFKPSLIALGFAPRFIAGYEADTRPGPVWRCVTHPAFENIQRPLLNCGGTRTESGSRMVDAGTNEVAFSIFDQDSQP